MDKRTVSLGFGGIEVDLGAHICAFYQGPAGRDELLIPFLAEGMRLGEKCLGVVESSPPEHVRDQLDGASADQVEVSTPAETYLGGGRFDPDEMLGWLDEHISHSLAVEGYPRVRSAGEMNWAFDDVPGGQKLFDYEARLNRFAPSFPQVILCMYDMDRVGGSVLIDAMKTHSQVLVGTLLCESPFYEPVS
jgi:hypothetical protein